MPVQPTSATQSEMQTAHAWATDHVSPGAIPFSFTYGGRVAAECLPQWAAAETERGFTWTDPRSGLECTLELTTYPDFPVVEWVVRLRNGGDAPTPILADVRSLDITLGSAEATLHHHKGDTCGADAFEPQALVLERETHYQFTPAGGRPTSMAWPFFNVAQEEGQGVIVVLGWPGQWKAEFDRDADGLLRVSGGQERTRFRLQPGEEAQTPRSVLLFWEGDRQRAQNLWRQWMLAHVLPRVDGNLHPPMTSQCMGTYQNAVDEKVSISALARENARVNYWWMDAGWWREGFPVTGNWEPDTERFPSGIRPVADHAHANGLKFVLWFEPERVSPDMPWATHDKWLLSIPPEAGRERGEVRFNGPKFTADEAARNQMIVGDKLWNLGNADARAFLTEFLAERIAAWDIDFLRIDFNISPLAFWQAADTPERVGLTENHYVTGWLTLLDDLRTRYPRLWIDTCASGGRRMDLETLRRTLPLLRSDYQFHPVGNQGHTFGLASWVPYFGTGMYVEDPYGFRSSLAPAMGLGYKAEGGGPDWDVFRRALAEQREIAPFFSGDFYPLTRYSLNPDSWIAWQFARPDLDSGMVQVFRRADSPFQSARLKLYGLDPEAAYQVHPAGEKDMGAYSGAELMTEGLRVEFQTAPEALTLVYQQKH